MTSPAPLGARTPTIGPAPGPSAAGRARSQEMFELAFGTVYAGLMTNFLLLVSALPLVVLLFTTDPARSWPGISLTAPLVAPGLVGAFAVFGALGPDGSGQVVRTFARAWWRHLRRSLAIGVLASGLTTMLALNLTYLSTAEAQRAALIPLQLVLGAAVAATVLLALVAVPELPEVRLRDLLRSALWLAARRWYLVAVALLVLSLGASAFVERPAIALGLAVAPLLYVAWGLARFALRPVLPSA
ncbi:MAG: ferredoxin-NADPH reductase [Promicromonosporaceae bacterium]|nr:ferredoxin-NADPH reductase [Promicromonosporaceae bacterium]